MSETLGRVLFGCSLLAYIQQFRFTILNCYNFVSKTFRNHHHPTRNSITHFSICTTSYSRRSTTTTSPLRAYKYNAPFTEKFSFRTCDQRVCQRGCKHSLGGNLERFTKVYFDCNLFQVAKAVSLPSRFESHGCNTMVKVTAHLT